MAAALEASLDEQDKAEASPEELEAAWTQELERRVDDALDGRTEARPAKEAIAEIRARLHAARVR